VSYSKALLLPLLVALGCKGHSGGDSEVDSPTPDGCGGDDAACDDGQICEDDGCVIGDRDNSFDDATRIYQEQPIDAAIEPEGDIDYYVYTSVGDEWIRVDTLPDEVDGGKDTVVSVYNATNGAVQAYIDDYATGAVGTYDSVLYAYLPSAGDWYISVQDRGTFYDDPEIPEETGLYTVEVKPFTGITDETDSMGDPSSSVELTDGSTIYAVGVNLADAGDTDWIDVSIPWDHGPIEIAGMSDIPGSDAHALVDVYDDAGTLLCSKDDLGPAGSAYYFDTTAGTYHVGATDSDGEGGPDHWYVLYFRTREHDYYQLEYETEPDDTEELPFILTSHTETTNGGTDYQAADLHGTFGADGDEDWYQVEGRTDDYVTVYCSASTYGSFADPSIEVFGPDGSLIGSAADGNDSAPDLKNLGPLTQGGSLDLHVTAENAEIGPAAYYTCTVYLTPFEVQ